VSMAETVHNLEPNRDDMLRHLSLLFGHATDYDDGLIEIAINTGRGWQGQLFGIDSLDQAVAFAAEQNQAGRNAYVGVALRDPDTAPFGRSSDRDHYATTVIGGDLDTAQASAAAVERTRHLPPSFVVCTGKHPHTRLQPFWQLEEAITDPDLHRELFGGVADMLDGDRSIVNPGRIMRLAGSIAWPVKEGRVPELTGLVPLKYEPRRYSAEAISKAFPNQHKVATYDPAHKNDPIERVAAKNSLGLDTGVLDDGRERYMRDTIMAVLVEIIGTTGSIPYRQELFEAAWPQYAAKVDLSRPGRGEDEMRRKIEHTLRRLERGQLRDKRGQVLTLDSAVDEWREKEASRRIHNSQAIVSAAVSSAASSVDQAADRFQWLTSTSISQPVLNGNWLIKRVLPAEGLGVIFGRPGSGKTFTVMDMAMHVAAGRAWRKLKTRQAGVSYVSPEAGRLGVNRVIGWCRSHATGWPEAFRLSPAPIDLCSTTTDADALIADIQTNQPGCRLVVIDTLNRAMAGGEENDGQDMGRFIALCDRIAKALSCFVLVVHHSGKDAAKGSRGHSSLLGAVSLEIEVTKEQGEAGTIKITKMRDGEDGAEYAFDIESVPLGTDEDGDEVTTGISVEADLGEVQQTRNAEPTGKNQRMVADAFAQYVNDCGRPNPMGVGYAEPGVVMVVDANSFVEFAAGKVVGKKAHEARRIVRDTIEGLVAKGYFAVNGGVMWRVH
jgi:hypothetical protein